MTIMASDWGKALVEGVHSFWDQHQNNLKTQYTKLFDISTSRKHYEEIVATTGMGLARVRAPGAAVEMDQERQFYITRFQHVEYALGYAISHILVEDDLYDVAAARKTKNLHMSMALTKETVAHNVINRATNSSYLGGDGVTLLSTAHLYGDGSTYANKPSTDVGLSAVALEDAHIAIMKYKNNAQMTAPVNPVSLHIPPDLVHKAARITKSMYKPGSADNDINTIEMLGLFPGGVHVHHFLTDTDQWTIKTDANDGLMFFERTPVKFGQTEEWDTDVVKFKASERYSVGWGNPRAVYGSTG